MKNDGLRILARFTGIFAVIALAVCLWRSATKPIAIAVQAQAKAPETQDELSPYEMSTSKAIDFADAAADGEDISIPLPGGVTSDDIQTENQYLSGQLWINIRGNDRRYEEGASGITANRTKVSECVYITSDPSEYSLRFGLTGVYEPQMSLVDGALHIRLLKPSEVYEHIVLVDPVPASGSLTDLSLKTAEALEILCQDDTKLRIYLTRMGQEYRQETALWLLRETDADFLIRLETVSSAGEEAFRMIYNGDWYLRRYTNAELSRDLASGVAQATGRMFTELSPDAGDDILLTNAEIPSARIQFAGRMEDAASWLNNARTPGRIAEGIRSALQTAADTIEERTAP